jgi:hypothetical protein
MSTSFSSPFTKFLSLLEDRGLSVNLTDEQMTDLMNIFLNQSSSLYFKNCAVDLTDRQIPDYLSENFTSTGSSNEFIISRYPTNPNSDSIELICQVDGGDIDSYTFDVITKKFTLDSTPTAGHTVTCGYNFIGQYNNDTDDEIDWILAYGMILGWLSGKLFNPSKLKERLSLKDWNSPHSPASLLKELLNLQDMAERKLRDLRVSYSFNDGYRFD